MKTIQNKIATLAASVLLAGAFACTDLTETPYDVITEDNIEFTDQDIDNMSGKVYQSLRGIYWNWNGYFDLMEESSDLIMTPARIGIGWGDYYILLHKHEFNGSSISHLWTVWDAGYAGILYANKCLDIPAVQENKAKAAELRTMRALFYYLLFDLFRNIPLDTTQNHPKGYLPEQAPPQATFNFIVNELRAAIPDLGTDKPYGYPNEYVARMILAKMYLNHNAWFNDFSSNEWYEKALAEVEVILGAGKYSLEPEYKNCFKNDLSKSPEVIFGVPMDGKYASGNYLVNKCLIAEGKKAFGATGTAWNGSCGIPQFMDTYDEKDQRFNDSWAHGQQYEYQTGKILMADGDADADGKGNGLGKVKLIYTKEVHSIDNPGAYMLEGYRFVKYEICADEYGTYGDDICFFRLADAMFIKAECLLRLGRDKATAAQLVTEVRQRSFKKTPAKATRTAADLEGASVYQYGHREWTSKGALVYDPEKFIETKEGGDNIELGGLLDDLAWEFVGEHHRRQDLVRFRLTGKDMNVFNGKSWFCKDAETDETDIHKNIYPIWQSFVESNIKIKQNPGYLQ
ncbi:MAG: RagB/SusD family nutrient uptake outer membrane protein [Prevotellaceae bacterium]|jgi:hypothetical protein|nr:RagB/SusD family nutrient uptake outer membrane protein [Prevotellaceae bacterium]